MIRLLQRKLIIPRGDTGSFSLPVLSTANANNCAVFTIFHPITHKKIYQKRIENNIDTITINFTHGDTVNLPVGRYCWDVKFYQNPVFLDNELIDGVEVDSYYAAFSLPECEIRPTGDQLITSDDAPTSTLAPDQINYINEALLEVRENVATTEQNVTDATIQAELAAERASAASTSADTAETAATQAYTSRQNADDAAADALSYKQDAETAASTATTAANAAATSASNASDSADTASAQAVIATTKASEANASASAASDSAISANASAIAANASATAAASSEVNAQNSATAAANSATSAGNSASAAAASANEIKSLSAEITTLPASENATVSYNSATGTLTFGIPQGDAFHIVKTYASIEAMNADYSGTDVKIGEFVMIVSNVQDADNAKVYVKGDSQYNFIVDMSGSAGIKGDTGLTPQLSIGTVSTVPTGTNATATITGTIEQPVLNLGLPIGATGNGIVSITKTGTSNLNDTYTVTYTNGTTSTFVITNGSGITNIAKTNTSGLVDTYTITYANGNTSTFTVTNGDIPNFSIGTVTEGATAAATITGTTANPLLNLTLPAANVPTKISELENDTGYLTQHQDISGKANSADLASVAISGSYNDLTNKPSIPIKISDLTDDSGHYTKPAGGIPASDIAAGVIPTVPVTDVQVNGTSVLSNSVANIPVANSSTYGTIKIENYTHGLQMTEGKIAVDTASLAKIKTGTNIYSPITPYNQDASSFYGLAKAAGDATQAASSNAVGVYTDTAKTAIRSMLGALGSNDLNDITTTIDNIITAVNTKASTSDIPVVPVQDVQVNGASVLNNGVANIPLGSTNAIGVVRIASDSDVQGGTHTLRPIVPSRQHAATFYGLAKAAGDSIQSTSSNAVGTYTDSAKAAIQHMLGTDINIANYESDTTADQAYAINELFMLNGKLHQATAAIAVNDTFTVGTNCAVVNAADVFPHDVQVNGTSVLTNGVANVPIATSSTLGVIKAGSGLYISNGAIYPNFIGESNIKKGTVEAGIISSARQHIATFYGLAKAAGDTTQSSSSNAVGTYTVDAQSAINSMLNAPQVINGTDPVIVGKAGIRYKCGECYTLSITPPASGIIDIIFESGSTPTVLTIPNTVEWPDWFDPTNLEANAKYEINIMDGVYGAVGVWT